ncbi:MAG: S8 family peptidase [Candidatus Helarchaeota archaeon]
MKKTKVLIIVFMMSLIIPISTYTASSVNYSSLTVLPQRETLSAKDGAYYNDPLYSDQWAVPSVGANLAHAMGITGANYTNSSDPIVVAVLDTGIDTDHEDLADNYQTGGIAYYGTTVEDGNGHGTHCAGIIAAVMNNSIGVVGVAPEAKVMPYKVLDVFGRGNLSYLRQAIDDIVTNYPPNRPDGKGVNIISMSLGVDIPNWDDLSPGDKAIMNNLNQSINNAAAAGIVLLAAAGNDAIGRVLYPAKFPNVIAIAATNVFQERASYSNWGPEIEYCAPGGDYYLGLILVGVLSTYPDDTYTHMAGTSMATPVAAGVVALLMSNATKYNYTMTINDVKGNLTAKAKDLGTAGWDQEYGNGMVQIVTSTFDYNSWFHSHYDLEILMNLLFLFGDMLTPQPPIDPMTIAIIAGVGIFFVIVLINEVRYRK